jgi:hypothetical protein
MTGSAGIAIAAERAAATTTQAPTDAAPTGRTPERIVNEDDGLRPRARSARAAELRLDRLVLA